MWIKILIVGLGGFVGANARFLIGHWVGATSYPYATFAINMLGCFGLGLFAQLVKQSDLSEETRLLIATGFFGAFTTYSTFNLEALNLWMSGRGGLAMLYLGSSIVFGLLVGWLGMQLARVG